jgi:hypothetical protein
LTFLQATQKATNAVPGAMRQAVFEAAMVVKMSILSQPEFPRGPLRGTAKNGRPGRKVNVGFDIIGSVNPTALVSAKGPFPLIERNSRAHFLGAKKVYRGTRRKTPYMNRNGEKKVRYSVMAEGPSQYTGSRPLKVNGNWRQGPWAHPGTRGKHVFEKGVEASRSAALEVYQRNLSAALATNLVGMFRAS